MAIAELDVRPGQGWMFCIIVVLLSWTLWLVEPAVRATDALTARLLVALGTFGPSVAAAVVRSVGRQRRGAAPAWQRLAAALLWLGAAVLAGWGDIAALVREGGSAAHWVLVVAVVVLPAALVASAGTGLAGLRRIGRPTRITWTGLAWWAVALAAMPALHIAGRLLEAVVGGTSLPETLSAVRDTETYRSLGAALLATALWGGPVGEEAGWRGFVLPRLQRRFDPLLSSVILGLFWGAWHLPLHLSGYYDAAMGSPLQGILLRALTTVPLSIVFTWLFNRSGGSVVAMVLLHTSVNVSSGLSAPGWGLFAVTAVAVVAVVVADRMYRRAVPAEAPPG